MGGLRRFAPLVAKTEPIARDLHAIRVERILDRFEHSKTFVEKEPVTVDAPSPTS